MGLELVRSARFGEGEERDFAHAPGGRVFVGALRADDCVRIIVIDDGKTAARPMAPELRGPLARLLARAGAGLVVDNRPGDGTTLVLSLPEAG